MILEDRLVLVVYLAFQGKHVDVHVQVAADRAANKEQKVASRAQKDEAQVWFWI